MKFEPSMCPFNRSRWGDKCPLLVYQDREDGGHNYYCGLGAKLPADSYMLRIVTPRIAEELSDD